MKRILLFISLSLMCTFIWASPARSVETGLTDQERQVVLNIVIDYLLFNRDVSADNPPAAIALHAPASGLGAGSSAVGGGVGTNGIEITVIGPGGKDILVRTGDGLLFNLTKISSSGVDVAADSEGWSCLRDNLTGLVWEVKTTDGGLHDQDNSFAWYNTDQTTNGGSAGFSDNSGATCSGYVAGDPSTYCNTEAFVARVNTDGWCGYQDWRVPTIEELAKIVSLNKAAPALYAGLFPRGTGKAVWSASPFPNYPGFAWHIYLNDGYRHGNDRSGNLPVLLVRNAQP